MGKKPSEPIIVAHARVRLAWWEMVMEIAHEFLYKATKGIMRAEREIREWEDLQNFRGPRA